MRNHLIKKILIIIMIILIIYITIECIRGATGRTPLIIVNTEKTTTSIREDTGNLNAFDRLKENRGIATEISQGLVFTSYKSYSTGLSTGWVSITNKLFDIITIYESEAH